MKQPRITGVGITDFGRFPELIEEAMVQSAILDALEDAGTRLSEVQAFYCGNALGNDGGLSDFDITSYGRNGNLGRPLSRSRERTSLCSGTIDPATLASNG